MLCALGHCTLDLVPELFSHDIDTLVIQADNEVSARAIIADHVRARPHVGRRLCHGELAHRVSYSLSKMGGSGRCIDRALF